MTDEQNEAWNAFEFICGMLNDVENDGGRISWHVPLGEFERCYGVNSADLRIVRAYMTNHGIGQAELRKHFDHLLEASG